MGLRTHHTMFIMIHYQDMNEGIIDIMTAAITAEDFIPQIWTTVN